jgi:hypothetical protein
VAVSTDYRGLPPKGAIKRPSFTRTQEAQLFMNALPISFDAPLSEIMIHRFPFGKIIGQEVPRTSRT